MRVWVSKAVFLACLIALAGATPSQALEDRNNYPAYNQIFANPSAVDPGTGVPSVCTQLQGRSPVCNITASSQVVASLQSQSGVKGVQSIVLSLIHI